MNYLDHIEAELKKVMNDFNVLLFAADCDASFFGVNRSADVKFQLESLIDD